MLTLISTCVRVRKLPEETGFIREEWKKLEKRYFLQFLPEESGKTGRKWKKLEEIHEVKCACTFSVGNKFPDVLWSNIGTSKLICTYLSKFWNFARFHWLSVHFFIFALFSISCQAYIHFQAALWLQDQRYNAYFSQITCIFLNNTSSLKYSFLQSFQLFWKCTDH